MELVYIFHVSVSVLSRHYEARIFSQTLSVHNIGLACFSKVKKSIVSQHSVVWVIWIKMCVLSISNV